MKGPTRPKILYLLTEGWFFRSHFLDRALGAKKDGYSVIVAAHDSTGASDIAKAGLGFVEVPFVRGGVNLFREFRTFRGVLWLYRAERPDLVHHVGLKPVIYGSLAARLSGVGQVVNAPVGMGFVFVSDRWLARLLRPLVTGALRLVLKSVRGAVIFENNDDLERFAARGLVRREDAVLIEGAGVDLDTFRPHPEPEGVPTVVLPARMIQSKGIGEFVEAAATVKAQGISARFVLAGAPDPDSRETIGENTLADWASEGLVEWIGHQSDMAAVLAGAHVVCLPSYREGLPKSLLEAAASGLPIVTTDVVGCRSVVSDGVNGLLVPPRDAKALAAALARLIEDPELRRKLGAEGRKRAEERFGAERILTQTLQLYRRFLDG